MEKVNGFYRLAAKDFPLSVSYYAPLKIADAPYYPQASPNLCVTLMQQGQVDIYTNGKAYILGPGDIFIIPPQQLYTFRTATMDTRYIYLTIPKKLIQLPEDHFFRQEFVDPLFSSQLHIPDLVCPTDPLYPVLSAPLQVLDRQKEGTEEYRRQLFSAVMSFCIRLMAYCAPLTPKEQASNNNQNTVLACIDYIRMHYSQQITLQDVANHVHLHPNYLCALFKEHSGKTVFEYLERYRVRRAVHLLRSTNLPVSQIAERCGFNSISFFSRKFRNITGFSPSQYRRHYNTIPPETVSEE